MTYKSWIPQVLYPFTSVLTTLWLCPPSGKDVPLQILQDVLLLRLRVKWQQLQ